MKTYKTQKEVEKDIVDGVLKINEDVTFECNIDIDASINAYNINALDINASNINANTIEYYAFCIAYETLKVKTIKGRRPNSFHKCLDNEIEYKKDTKTISIDGKNIEISNAVQKERERIWQDYKTQETMHNMMLDSLSIMSIEKFVVWRDERKAINQDHE